MNQKNVTNCCCEFSKGKTDVHDKQSSTPPLISDNLLQKVEGEICTNQHRAIRELHHIIPEVSKTTIHEAVTVGTLGGQKLTDDHHCAPESI
jgi:hypothetical protein